VVLGQGDPSLYGHGDLDSGVVARRRSRGGGRGRRDGHGRHGHHAMRGVGAT
jgi:hypothetical protein